MQRIAQVVALRPEAVARYRELHRAVWPDVLRTIAGCHIRNYSIYLLEPQLLLFAYFEYHGEDLDADLARMAEDPVTQEWWTFTDPLQQRLDGTPDGAQWSPTVEVFHTD